MKGSTIAIIGLAGLGTAALAQRLRKFAPGRIGPPTQQSAPEPDAPTIAMMKAATPPAPQQGSWSRLVAQGHSAQRTRACMDSGHCVALPMQILFGGQPLDPAAGAWISVRLWCETIFSPVREVSRPAASYWAWSGALARGKALPVITSNVPVIGSGLPAASWIKSGARISVADELQVSWRYPGDEHTGIERGRSYDIVLEWRQTPNKPQ